MHGGVSSNAQNLDCWAQPAARAVQDAGRFKWRRVLGAVRGTRDGRSDYFAGGCVHGRV